MEKQFCYDYARPAVACDCVVVNEHNEILLIKRKHAPCAGMWALPGGFLEEDETAEQGAVRELQEEAGLNLSAADLQLNAVFSDPKRDERTRLISLSYFVRVKKSEAKHVAGDDAADAEWHSLNALPALAFDHGEIIGVAMRKFLNGI